MPNGNEMAGFYIDKLSLSQRLSIVSETYDRVNKNNKKEKLKYSYDDIEMIKKRFVKYIDAQLYSLIREGLSVPATLTQEEKIKITDLAIDAALFNDYERFNELIIYISSLGISVTPPLPQEEGGSRLYIYFSGDIHAYMDVWRGDLLLGSGTELSDIQSITGLRFMIDMAESLKLNIINPADKAMVDLINHLRYEMISYASSFCATYSAERGGTVYLSSPDGLRINNYFWNSELPVLRALQKKGLIGDIRILHKPLEFYKDTPLDELGDLLTAKDISMTVEYQFLPVWLQEKLLVDIYQQWLDEEFQHSLLAVRKEIINTIDIDRHAPEVELLRYFLRKIHEQLDEITEFKVLKEAERIDSIKKKLAVGSEIESWLDNVPAIDVNERKIILESLLQKESLLFSNVRDIKKSIIPLDFNSDVININTSLLKNTFIPFNLLRESWDVIISDRSLVEGTLTIHFSVGRKIMIKVDANRNQLKQMATLERFLLANFTPRNTPQDLKIIDNVIMSGDVVLAERRDDKGWHNDQQMIEKVKLSEFDYFLKSNDLGVKINDNGFVLYLISDPEDNRDVIIKPNDDYNLKSIKDFIENNYLFFDDVPEYLIVKKNVENKECIFAHDEGETYQVAYRDGEAWVLLSKMNTSDQIKNLNEITMSVNLNNAESRSLALILSLLKKHDRLVSILPDTHPKVMENFLDIDSLLKNSTHPFEHPLYRKLLNSISNDINKYMESLNEIKDSYHLLPFDVRPGQYMNTWSKIDRDTVIEYSIKQNDKNNHPQFIVLLQDDSLSKRVGEIIASYNHNKSIVLQFDARSSEARIAYGAQNNITEMGEFELSFVTHGTPDGLYSFSIANVIEIYKLTINSFALPPPVKIRLVICSIADNGQGAQGFNGTHPALGIVNMMHQEGFDIPILAYTTKVGVSVEHPGELVVFNSEKPGEVLKNIDDYQVLYHYKNNILLTDGVPVVELLLKDVRNKIKSVNQLIESYSQYLVPFFSDDNGVVDRELLELTINDFDTHSKFENFLDIIRQRPELRNSDNWQLVVANNATGFLITTLDEPVVKYPDIVKVNEWDLPAIANIDKTATASQYDMQIVFQCENNPTVNRAATRLAGKHAKNSIIIQLDVDNNHRAFIIDDNIHAEWREISHNELVTKLKIQPENGKIRWQVVGHGRSEGGNDKHPTLAGQRPEQLTARLNQFSDYLQTEHQINISPQQVSLVGCAMSSSDRYTSFAHKFMSHLNENGIRTNVSASTKAIEVDPLGHKHDVDTPDIDSYNNKYLSSIKGTEKLYWNRWGEITTERKKDINGRLNNIDSLLDNLITRQLSVNQINKKQQRKLAEIFPQLTDKKLNKGELLLTLHDSWRMQTLKYDLLFLQKISDRPDFDTELWRVTDRWRITETDGNTLQDVRIKSGSQHKTDLATYPHSITSDPDLKTSNPKARTAIFGRFGYGMQGYGFISALRLSADYQRWMSNGDLTEKQEEEIQLQLAMAWGGIGANLATDGLQYAFGKWGIGYLQKLVSKGGRLSPALLSQLTLLKRNPALLLAPGFLKDLRKLALNQFAHGAARFSMPLLSALTSGIDIYQAYHAFSQLATETDPHVRRDLIASGVFSTINATIGLGVAFAMAMGGTAATAAGPAGIALAFTMIIVGDIYSAVSQIERIRDIVPDMTGSQRFENGLRLFLKFGLTPGLDNQIRYNQTMESVYQRQRDYYEALLASKQGVDTLFYSRGEAVLKAIPFIKRDERSQTERDLEKISIFSGDPFTNAKIYTTYAEMGKHEYYELDKINDVDDYVIADFFEDNNRSVVKLQNKNLHQAFSELDIDSTYSPFILSADVDRNGLNDFIVINEKYNTTIASRKNSVGMTVIDDYVSRWHYELYTWLAQPDGSYLKIDTRLEWEKLFHAIEVDKFNEVVFPVLGDFNGDNVFELVIFHDDKMTTYHYDSLDFNQSGKDNHNVINIGDFIEPVRLAFEGEKSKNYPYSLVGDINNDGFDDILLLNKSGDMLHLMGNSSGVFRQHKTKLSSELTSLLSSSNLHRSQLQLTDLNKDGGLDLVIILNDGIYYQALGDKIDGEYHFDTPSMVNKITIKTEGGDSVRYQQNRLSQINKNKIIAISPSDQGENRLISLSDSGELLAHPLREIKENDVAALFDLGGGDDVAKGYHKKKNIFTIGSGFKQYQGGENADTFILTSAAASKSHILSGGEGNDTVALGEVLGNEIDSIIDISKGYYSQVNGGVEKQVALLYDFENILGHENVNDTIIGNDVDNYLNGMGGDDKIWGNGGNDLLALQSGLAQGGTGLDSYHILKSTHEKSLQIRIEEVSENNNTDMQISNIFLEHKLNQIKSIELDNIDVLININNDNGFMTQIRLVGVYNINNNQKQQVLNFTIQTVDGFTMVPLWPSYLNEITEFSPNMVAYYSSLVDRNYKELVGKGDPDDIVVRFSLDNGYQQQQVTHLQRVEGEKDIVLRQAILPDFIRLSPQEHSMLMGFLPRYELLGDNKDNLLQVLSGEGLLEGRGGQDTYLIQEKEGSPTDIIINNFDDSLASDNLVLSSWLLCDVIVERSDDDLLLRYRDQPEKHQSIRLVNYMNDERYRHLKITDKSGQSQYRDPVTGTFIDYQINLDKNGHPFIAAQQAPVVSSGNDEVVINSATFLPGNYIDTGDGNDAIIYIRGHEGTMLKGGGGDDTYYYSAGSGAINIADTSGLDHLYLDKHILLHTLSAERRENNLVLNIADNTSGRIIFVDWYLADENKVDFIWVEGSQITFDELFSLCPYSDEYYQLCQQLKSMGLSLTVRQLADLDSQDGYNTLNQLRTIKAWATKNPIYDVADLDYLVAMSSIAWRGNARNTDPLPLIEQKIDAFFQPLIAERISLTEEHVTWIQREEFDTVDIAKWVKNYHLRSQNEINYLLEQLGLLKESPLSDKALDFTFKNRIDLAQADIELCQQECGINRQSLINLAMKYHVTGRGHFELLISNIQVLKEYGVVVSESEQPLVLRKPIDLRQYFNQKNLTKDHVGRLAEHDMSFDELTLLLDKNIPIEQAFTQRLQTQLGPLKLFNDERVLNQGDIFDQDISQLAEAMGGLESTESYSLPLERQTAMAITTHQFVSDSIAAY
ncbi:putative virulence determinant [Yersinia pseudotuberculosis]|uniref:C80 family cysteine peptidase n=1 Tax=Yersinia pseudotuberculosis TaxID=633 RepID=UPI0005DBBB36|nr:C80 family cysteine peptidase [Yersinia pseudotuberculosis]MBO1553403.1 RTX toxin [Yersinia pseudotuberculosis]CNK17975.1 putative virulence determinant [Yersinia pseudotuberculosis]CNK34775.1 putative virulence determinant [Yersinia pseudotuberculosis]